MFKEKVKEIGSKSFCSLNDLKEILPDFPSLKGSEDIFKINHANAKEYIDDKVDDLIKGLHCIEEAYKKETRNDFGFGSPSPTAKVIDTLKIKDPELAEILYNWVADNGGNYYIKSNE